MSGKKTIFLVDDNETNLMLGKTILSDLYNVLTLNSAARMFKALEKITPSLILLDVLMPETDGYAALARLKGDERVAGIPVIFLTALEGDKIEHTEDVVDVITKPFAAEALLASIKNNIS